MLTVFFDFVPPIIYSFGVIWFYYYWKQDYHPSRKWSFQLLGIMILLSTWSLFEEYVLDLQGMADWVSFAFLTVARVITLGLLGYVFFWPKIKYFKSWEKMSGTDYLCQYINYAEVWGKRLDSRDSEVVEEGEKAYDMSWWIYLRLQHGDSKSELLQKLLRHKKEVVRVLAARHLLKTVEKKSLSVLDAAGSKQGELARVAREWAEAYRTGNLQADPVVQKPEV